MPTSAERPDVLVDTSVAVALVVGDHRFHEATMRALEGRRLGLAGHAAVETFSVLTRLPPPSRRGSVYDALVGATAVEHRSKLATRDRRAVDTYRALGVDVELLPDD